MCMSLVPFSFEPERRNTHWIPYGEGGTTPSYFNAELPFLGNAKNCYGPSARSKIFHSSFLRSLTNSFLGSPAAPNTRTFRFSRSGPSRVARSEGISMRKDRQKGLL
jgi:hypothetical protein